MDKFISKYLKIEFPSLPVEQLFIITNYRAGDIEVVFLTVPDAQTVIKYVEEIRYRTSNYIISQFQRKIL